RSYRRIIDDHREAACSLQRSGGTPASGFATAELHRDTQRARLEWFRARTFVTTAGGVTERKIAVDASEELGRKGQELREMTRDLDLLKVDIDVIAAVMRLRGAPAPIVLVEQPADCEADVDHPRGAAFTGPARRAACLSRPRRSRAQPHCC